MTILSDVAELADQIDVPRAEAALARAGAAGAEDEEAAEAGRRAQLRLDIARGAVGSRGGAAAH